jgi:hypothetical protein
MLRGVLNNRTDDVGVKVMNQGHGYSGELEYVGLAGLWPGRPIGRESACRPAWPRRREVRRTSDELLTARPELLVERDRMAERRSAGVLIPINWYSVAQRSPCPCLLLRILQALQEQLQAIPLEMKVEVSLIPLNGSAVGHARSLRLEIHPGSSPRHVGLSQPAVKGSLIHVDLSGLLGTAEASAWG